ncbi:MAG: class I SAM-dependent methyltransferase [Planctomycetota bacterium]
MKTKKQSEANIFNRDPNAKSSTRSAKKEKNSLFKNLVPVLYEDAHLLAVTKPAGIDTGDAREGKVDGLVEILNNVLKQTLHASNRLSRYESGILLLAKQREVADRIRTELRLGKVSIEYAAVVSGSMVKPKTIVGGTLPPVLGERKGSRRPRESKKRVRLEKPEPEGSKKKGFPTIITLTRHAEDRCLVRCETREENTHALRARLRSAGLRLIGDALHDRPGRLVPARDTCLHLSKISLGHPAKGLAFSVRSEPPRAFGTALFGKSEPDRILQAALVRRLPCLLDSTSDSYRLLTGPFEDFPGLVVEKYGPVLIFQVQDSAQVSSKTLSYIARWYLAAVDARAVYVKNFVRDRGGVGPELDAEMRSPEPLAGQAIDDAITILENGLRFVIHPYDGFNVGLFLDHRENRRRIRDMSKGLDVLNLFAYTCGFSVAAAVGGAAKTVSVDIAPKVLEWGKVNFEANGFDPSTHEFIRADASEFLDRAAKKDRSFDVIVVDPPTFAHGRKSGKHFSIDKDLTRLLSQSLRVLRPGGTLLLSTNHRRLAHRALRQHLYEAAAGRRFEIIAAPKLPLDFAVDRDHAKTLIARFED